VTHLAHSVRRARDRKRHVAETCERHREARTTRVLDRTDTRGANETSDDEVAFDSDFLAFTKIHFPNSSQLVFRLPLPALVFFFSFFSANTSICPKITQFIPAPIP
jgi:hypothetical protein